MTVTQRVATLSWTNLSFVYDGTAKVPTCTISNLYGSDAVSATVVVDDGPAIQPATYTARVTGLTGDKAANYSLPATVTTSFTIVSESVILDDNGGAEGEGSVTLIDGAPEKATVTRPFYNGYSFRGYWTTRDGGSQVYDQTGALVANPPTLASGDTIYAHWEFVETYYLAGTDSGSGSLPSFEGTPSGKEGTANGWAEVEGGLSVRHTVAAGHDYVAKALLNSADKPGQMFMGDSLTLSNWLYLQSDMEIPNLISANASVCLNKNNVSATLSGSVQIQPSKSFSVVVCRTNRRLDVHSTIVGDSSTTLLVRGSKPSSGTESGLAFVLSGDASAFKGQLYHNTTGSSEITCPVDISVTGSFGGRVKGLPPTAANVVFNYDGLPETRSTRGLEMSCASLDDVQSVQSKITFYSTSADFTAANFPLMTFPAGTTVDPADFTVNHATAVDGAKTAFTNLGKIVNGDGSVTLVANFAIAVTLNPNGGTGGTTLVSAPVGAAMPAITVPTYAGHTFLGYYTAATGGTQYYTATGASARNCDFTTATVTLYAQWLTQVAKPKGASKVTYDSTVQTGVVAGEGYTLSGDASARNAGTYTVTATLKAGYIWSDGSSDPYDVSWTMNGAPITVEVNATARQYNGGSDVDVSLVSVSGVYPGDDYHVDGVTAKTQKYSNQWGFTVLVEDVYGDAEDPKILKLTLQTSGADAGNYTFPNTRANGRIDPREISIAWAGGPEFAYDGNPHKPTVTLGNFVDGEVSASTATIEYRDSHGTVVANPTEPGAYTATVTAWSVTAVPDSNYKDSNYTLPTEASYAFTIGAAPNAWKTVPKLSAATFPANRPASITWGVAQYGGDATATLDGAAFAKAGALPANLSVGAHTLVFTVAETPSYTGLSETLVFTVTEALYDLHAIRADGPVVSGVAKSWLAAAFPKAEATQEGYQSAFLTTNAQGVVAWQAYVLGYAGGEVASARIAMTQENAASDGIRVTLVDLPAAPRTQSCTLAYSLVAARTPDAAEWTLVEGTDGEVLEKMPQPDFVAPYRDLTNTEPVNYYQIKVHFIFEGGDEPEPKATVFYAYPDSVDPDALPSGWTKDAPGPGKDNEYYLRTGAIDIPSACLDDGYVRVSFETTVKYNGGYFTLTFLDENGQQLTAVDSLKVAVDSLATTENGQLVTKVYRLPAGADVKKIRMQWSDSNAARAKSLPQDFSDVQVSNIKVESLNYLAAASEVDAIFGETVDSTAYATAKATYFDARSANADWTRGLQGLHDALVNGGDYDILVMGDSLCEAPVNGGLEALIKRQWPQSNVRVHVCWSNNTGCPQFLGTSTRYKSADAEAKYASLDFTKYDCVIFSGTTQARYAGTLQVLTDAVTTINTRIKTENPNCSVVFLAPQLSVDSRYFEPWGAEDAGNYWDTAKCFFAGYGLACAERTDFAVASDGWAEKDYNIMSGAMPGLTEGLGMAYWNLYEFAYDYLFRSGKPYFYYSRDAQHANEYNRVLSAMQLLEVFKLVAAKDYTTP